MTTVELAVREAYSAYYIFASLGYESGEILVGIHSILNADPPGLYSTVTLKKGGKTFVYHQVMLTNQEAADFDAAWPKFVENKPNMSEEELDRLVHSSDSWGQKVALLDALRRKGFLSEPGKIYH